MSRISTKTVAVPVVSNGRVTAAIWRYYSTRVRYKGRVNKPGRLQDACHAECWGALMAYCEIVEEFSK